MSARFEFGKKYQLESDDDRERLPEIRVEIKTRDGNRAAVEVFDERGYWFSGVGKIETYDYCEFLKIYNQTYTSEHEVA